MVQPTSAILILGLGFPVFSPIDYLGSTCRPFYPSSFLRIMHPLCLPPFILPPRLLLRHPFSTVLVSCLLSVWGFLLRPSLQV